ncbi:MAG: protein TolQ [Gammaproteobacteria bacterium]|nr:protein TolQ [Gammaproteobacteria bacterium]
MSNEISVLNLVLDASLLVQLVMLSLLAASVISWAQIRNKARQLKAARISAAAFEQRFWGGEQLDQLYQDVTAEEPQGLEAIFVAGYREFRRWYDTPSLRGLSALDNSARSMRAALNRELDALETHLSFLATVGSTSPYVGLFGTVWGIMTAFIALGNVKQASLSAVAPGIAEALIATAMGLFAAIPAVIAYNRFAHDVERLTSQYESFIEEFGGILERQGKALDAGG